jgi:hypothetical protein
MVVPLATVAAAAAAPDDDAQVRALAKSFQAGVEILADDSMEGRGIGTDGLRKAAAWLEDELRRMGLEPAFGSGYRQSFQMKVGVKRVEGNRLEGVAEEDWTPLGFSSSGPFSGELAFLGYGIQSEEIGYRELEGIPLQGKIALILRYEPQERDEASPFDGKKPSRWSAMRYKTLQVRERGASAVIFVTGAPPGSLSCRCAPRWRRNGSPGRGSIWRLSSERSTAICERGPWPARGSPSRERWPWKRPTRRAGTWPAGSPAGEISRTTWW